MKRNEIKVGDELYYDKSTDWATSSFGGRKATVVDTKPYKAQKARWSHRTTVSYSEDPKGNCVLVDLGHFAGTTDDGRAERAAVPLAHLRGSFAETYAAVLKGAEEKRDQQRMESERQVNAWTAARLVEVRAREAGIRVGARGDRSLLPVIEVSVEDFAKLLNAFLASR